MLGETRLADEQAFTGEGTHAALFEEFAADGRGGRFTELDVSPGQVVVALLEVSACKQVASVDQDPAGDEFDVGRIGHDREHTLVDGSGQSTGRKWGEVGTLHPSPWEGRWMTTGKARPRLGRGLSALLGQPVSVEPQTRGEDPVPEPVPVAVPQTGAAGSQLQLIGVASVVPSRFQPRQVMDDAALERLAASIRVSGVIQPIAVRASTVGGAKWELVAGERRWRAAQRAGLERIPAVVVSLDDRESAEWGLIENVQREDLNAIERGWALRKMVEQFELAHDDVAERVGLERSSVTNLIRLTELEKVIQDLIGGGQLSAGHGKALLAMNPGGDRVEMARRAAQHKWSVRRLETLSRAKKAGEVVTSGVQRSVQVADLERQLSEHLGTKVRISTDKSGVRGRLVVNFFDLDQFDGILTKIGWNARS